jgi:hypothetical protein
MEVRAARRVQTGNKAFLDRILAFAEECEHLAGQAEMARHRMVLREMAEAWRKLAREGDRTGEELRC